MYFEEREKDYVYRPDDRGQDILCPKTFYEIYTSMPDAVTEAWIDRRVDINLCVDISESGIIVEDYLDLELTDEYIEHFGGE